MRFEPGAEGADVGAGWADLEEHAGLAQGTATTKVAGFERARTLGDQAIEATHLLDVAGVHSLTLVRELELRQLHVRSDDLGTRGLCDRGHSVGRTSLLCEHRGKNFAHRETTMSGTISAPEPATVDTTPKQVVRTEFFTYSKDATPSRNSEQVWNVHSVGSVWVQGELPTTFGPGQKTSFAKKHLITFAGGKQSKKPNGTPELKAASVSMKRTKGTLGSSAQKKKKKEIGPKYGSTLTDTNTVLICDYLVGAELKKMFANACKAAKENTNKDLIATVTLPGSAVMVVTNGSTIASIPGVGTGDTVDVDLKISGSAGSRSDRVGCDPSGGLQEVYMTGLEQPSNGARAVETDGRAKPTAVRLDLSGRSAWR